MGVESLSPWPPRHQQRRLAAPERRVGEGLPGPLVMMIIMIMIAIIIMIIMKLMITLNIITIVITIVGIMISVCMSMICITNSSIEL